ncbi:MAG: hypothetical protein WDZ45_10825 [Flavobacteriaceae bacterium]
MTKRARIIVGSIVGLLILIVIASFVINPIIENKIKKTIAREIPEEFQINDYDISVSTFSGSVTIENLQATVKDTISVFRDSQISLTKASVSGLSYWKYLLSNRIAVDDITLYDLHIKTYRDTTKTDDSPEKKHTDFKENISAGKFTLDNASFLFKNTDESIALQVDSLNFSIKNVVVNKTTLQEKIPFYFSEMEVDTRDFFYEINETETLSLKEFSVKNQQLEITNFTIQTKADTLYSNEEATKATGRKDIKIPKIAISDLHFKVVDDTFQLFGENLELDSPSILIQKGFKETSEESENAETEENKKEMPLPFSLGSVTIKDAGLTILNPDASTNLQVEDFNLTLKNALVNTATLQQKIPARFSDLEITSNSIQYLLNDYDLLSLTSISLENNELQIEDLAIKTIHSKRELSRVISKERDHMDAEMPLVTIRDFHFEVLDTTFQVSASDFIIENPILKVYRDKLVRDDTSTKPLYSKAIRNIPFPLTLDSLHINNATIVYEERVSARQRAGVIDFSKLNVAIGNVSNTYAQGEKKTTIKINSIFMDESPLKIDWSFDVNDLKDTFHIQGELDALNATKMNSFTKSSLNVNLEGKVKKTYFNIHGNDETSSVDLRISYNNFKVEILNKENKRNWILSTVANIFVKKKSDTGKGTFKEGKATAQRNKDKSFFNYLWINIQEGLKDVMVAI